MSTQPFGGWLRHEREARGLTVEAIASQTKIPPRHIEALERGDALALPAFYQRAEIRTVARAVGVDPQLALARLEAERAPADPPPPAPATPTPVRSYQVLAIAGMVVLVIGLAGWSSFERTAASKGALATPASVAAPPAAPLLREVPGVPTIEAVAASAPAPLGPTELVIRTQPEGARVTVNGIGWGASPVTIRHLEPGEKRIRVTLDGYAATERSVTIDEGRRESIRIRLSSASAGS
ncbi:MAG TPA: helix-turn-helix domain-containing protein [Vicinamibacterales bacterium]|jgi:transcriptional regulator with XRE-family HTH domain|nr:helix-turn-helix domain-containing protein [Vicinamibacterales bacterium]